MKKIVLAAAIIFVGILFIRFAFGGPEDDWICQDGEWIKHGNPKNPQPNGNCGTKPATGEENCTSQSGKIMNLSEAVQIAEIGCTNGSFKENHFCNPNSGTWWIDFSPNEPKEGCNPACVVFVDSGEVEINWRCTGLIEKEGSS